MGKPENTIESYLYKETTKHGFECFKFISGKSGVPDRILLGNGQAIFVEIKAPKQKPRRLQVYWLKKIQQLGLIAGYLDSREACDRLIQDLKKHQPPTWLNKTV